MTIIGLDLSITSTGIAWGDSAEDVTTIGTEPPKAIKGQTKPQRSAQIRAAAMGRIRTILCDVLARTDTCVRLVVIEHYALHSRSSQLATLAELGGIIRWELRRRGVAYLEVSPTTLKKFATGSGKADKVDMLLDARERLGYQGRSHDEADALWLREIGRHVLGDRDRVKLPKKNMEALEALTAAQGVTV